ncbi:hypothetical protein IZS01_005405 [Salmonella enterica]|nr:hypothetical protein [Salmonella enterica]EGP4108384.1 hypothetical protein [Salmonella enterica]
MRYLILIISLTGGFLSFYSFANDVSLPPVTVGTIYHDATLDSNGYFHTTWYGIPYICFDCHFNPDGKTASGTWYINNGSYDVPFPDKKPDTKPDDKPDTKPDDKPDTKPDDKPDTKPDVKPDVTPPVIDVKPPQPEKPYPANAGASQLLDLYSSCHRQAYSIPTDDNLDNAFNSVARNCNAILNRLSSVLVSDEVNSLSSDAHKFLTKNGSGSVLSCHKTTDAERQQMIANGYYPSMVPDVIGSYVSGIPYRDGHLNFNYATNDGAAAYCNSVYQDYMNSLNKPSDSDNNPSDNTDVSSSGSSSCPAGSFNVPGQGCLEVQCSPGFHPVAGATSSDYPTCAKDDSDTHNPGSGGGSGSGSTDNNDNGDVVAAINAFHADNNKNHKELMDDLNKKPVPPDYTGMEGDFSSMVGGAMSGITDSVKSAWDAGKTAFGEGLSGIDSMLPNIKTSFDLPPGFEAASLGRCIPVVLDFDIKLIGIPDYHFHAVGTQVCLLYDKYIRPVLNFVMVMLSFFVIHRLLIRSAEFLTDGRN